MQTENEIKKWKEKYRMLRQYKREEERNFKEKFEYLMDVEENRCHIKSSLNQLKNN